MRKSILLAALLAGGLSSALHGKNATDLIRKADAIHQRVFSVDTHIDVPIVMQRHGFDIRRHHDVWDDVSQFDLPRMIEGGLDGGFLVVYLPQGPRTLEGHTDAKQRAEAQFDLIHNAIEQNSDIAGLALSPEDAYRLRDEEKRAIFIGLENGWMIGRDLDLIEHFHNRGGRYLGLAHTSNNDICDSSTAEPEHGGLSDFGRLVVRELNRVGMMVDISHISDDAAAQAIELSKAPVIASHSSAYAVYPHPRNINDDLLRKIAANGGVVQMNMFSSYLRDIQVSPERRTALREWWQEFGRISDLPPERHAAAVAARARIDREHPPELATLEDVMEHIDHIVQLIGVDHVGIGADFDGGGGVVGCYDVSEVPNVTRELVRRGYSEEDIEKIWSGNLFRVMLEVERVAADLRKAE